jgi:rubrerythrin
MDIFDFAIEKEKEAEKYYREIAEFVSDKGLSRILTMLADEEVKHRKILEEMKTRSPAIAETDILKDVKNVFVQFKDEKDSFNPNISQIDMYKKAQERERQSMDFYQEKSDEVELPEQKELLVKMAGEEKRHFFILENIIDFVSRPETWLENAEFNRLEEY